MKTLVISDVESDDFIAIILLLEYYKQNDLDFTDIFLGVSLGNAYRKAAILEKLTKAYGINQDIVYIGTGGYKSSYPEEGEGILSDTQVNQFNNSEDLSCDELKNNLPRFLQGVEDNSVNVVLLTNPIDFIIKKSWFICKIRQIFVMGGAFNNRISYNWAINLDAARNFVDFVQECNIPTYIFSSQLYSDNFDGHINKDRFPELMDKIMESTTLPMYYFRAMMRNWDNHFTDYGRDEAKIKRIGQDNVGKQFSPADPVCMLSFLHPEIMLEDHRWILRLERKKMWMASNEDSPLHFINKVDIPKIEELLFKYIS